MLWEVPGPEPGISPHPFGRHHGDNRLMIQSTLAVEFDEKRIDAIFAEIDQC